MAVTVKVRCLGKLHQIHLADNGQLCLVDHPKDSWEDLLAMQALSNGDDCRCAKVMRVWKGRWQFDSANLLELPDALKSAYKYWRYDPKATRIVRKKTAMRGATFINGTAIDYPASFNIEEGVTSGGKMQNFALAHIVEELKKRLGYEAIEVHSADSSNRWDTAWVKLDDAWLVTFESRGFGQVTINIHPQNNHNHLSISASKTVFASDVADAVELGRISRKLRTHHSEAALLQHNQQWVAASKRINAKFKYSNVSSAFTGQHYAETGGIFVTTLNCKDPAAAAILAAALNQAAAKLIKQGRISTR